MGVILSVPIGVLLTAQQQWDAGADKLDGAWRRLHTAETGGLSAEVVAAVDAFREPWVDEIKAAGRQAQGYAEEVRAFSLQLVHTDAEQAEKVRALLPWVHHAAEIVE